MAVYFRTDNIAEQTTDADVNIYGAAFANDNTSTLASLNISGLNASSITVTDGSKNLASGTLSSNITLTTGELDTVQDIQITSSPTFVNVSASSMGTGTTDLTTKGYVDALSNGIKWKASARAGTTGNITLENEQTIDTVVCVAGDRVLVKDQSTASQNGIYTVVDLGSWTRTSDADSATELVSATIAIEEGSANVDGIYYCTNDEGFILDTNDVNFVAIFTSVPGHNSLANIQGGTSNEYYHLTSSEHTELTGWLDNVTLASNGDTTLTNLTATGDVRVDSAASATLTIDRGTGITYAALEFETAATPNWRIGTVPGSTNFQIFRHSTSSLVFQINDSTHEMGVSVNSFNINSAIDSPLDFVMNSNNDSIITVDRGATNDVSVIKHATAGVASWEMGPRGDSTKDYHIYRNGGAATESVMTFDHSARAINVTIDDFNITGAVGSTILKVDGPDSSFVVLERNSNITDFAHFQLRTNSSTSWGIGMNDDSTEDYHIYRNGGGGTESVIRCDHAADEVEIKTSELKVSDAGDSAFINVTSANDGAWIYTDRNATNTFNGIYCQTASAGKWHIGSRNDASDDLHIYRFLGGGSKTCMRFDYAADEVYLPTVYAATVTSSRDLEIQSDGKIGYVSSTTASKINIANITDPSWIYQLTPKQFNYRERDPDGAYTAIAEPALQYGLLAEDLQSINDNLCIYDTIKDHVPECDPESCSCPTHQELSGIYYKKLIAPMIQIIKDLNARLAALE